MRILVCSNYFPEHIGGIETVAQQLCREYRDRGHEVRWVAADVRDRPHHGAAGDRPLPCWNVTERSLGFPYPLPSPRSLVALRADVAWADAVHLHDCLYAANLAAFAWARRARKPVLVTQHVAEVAYRRRVLRIVQAAAYRSLGRALLEGADQVVFCSSRVMSSFSGRFSFRRPPRLIENGFDASLFKRVTEEERGAIRARLGLPEGPVLLFVGRFVEKKGLSRLRSVIEATPAWRWVLVGPPGDAAPERWGLPNVRVVGPVAQAELALHYAAADLMVLPSSGEGFPVAVQEAMACGTPALVTDETASALPGAGGLVFSAPPQPEAFEAAARAALGRLRPAFRQRVGDFALARWSSERSAGLYLELLGELAGQPSGSSTLPISL